jgi:hypothetical protein
MHARQQARLKNIAALPSQVEVDAENLVELETLPTGKPVKAVFRVPYSSSHDLCMAVLLNDGVVKTVWLNSVRDLHGTLDRTKYCIPTRG